MSIHACRWSVRHLVAYEGDSAIYDVVLAPWCYAPPSPLYFVSGAHSHSLADEYAPIRKVAKCSCISKFDM